jgi:CarD family transcriptional regulator
MFTRAKKILASELMYALEMDEEQVDEHLTGLLTSSSVRAAAATSAVADDEADEVALAAE